MVDVDTPSPSAVSSSTTFSTNATRLSNIPVQELEDRPGLEHTYHTDALNLPPFSKLEITPTVTKRKMLEGTTQPRKQDSNQYSTDDPQGITWRCSEGWGNSHWILRQNIKGRWARRTKFGVYWLVSPHYSWLMMVIVCCSFATCLSQSRDGEAGQTILSWQFCPDTADTSMECFHVLRN